MRSQSQAYLPSREVSPTGDRSSTQGWKSVSLRAVDRGNEGIRKETAGHPEKESLRKVKPDPKSRTFMAREDQQELEKPATLERNKLPTAANVSARSVKARAPSENSKGQEPLPRLHTGSFILAQAERRKAWLGARSLGHEETRQGHLENVPNRTSDTQKVAQWDHEWPHLAKRMSPNIEANARSGSAPVRGKETESSRDYHGRSTGFVGFDDDSAPAPAFGEPARGSPAQKSPQAPPRPRRGSGRFSSDQADQRTYDAAPKSRDRTLAFRRSTKSELRENDEADIDDIDELGKGERSRRAHKGQRKSEKASTPAVLKPMPIELPPFISVANLATALRARQEDFVAKLEELGFEDIAMDHVLNAENAGLVAMEYNFEPIPDQSEIRDLKPCLDTPADRSLLPQRPPVVTIMGHVDHGKTTLLDYLRKASVAASEFGGITQHIGAFSVSMTSGKLVTFLDTPGHSAFLAMRQRGANVTDIVILVVAADDSVKPQTVEAIRHARTANVPMIVAINKVDKDEANVDRVKKDLLSHDLAVEDFGGDVQAVEVSGKTGQGLPDLEEATVALAELLDMRADKDGVVEGWVLEATTKKAGRVATVLVRRGTLRVGDILVAGTAWARVRSLRNEAGTSVPLAGPGTPVEVDGWRNQPSAGDEVLRAPDEDKANDVVAYRGEKAESRQAAADMDAINEIRRIEGERRAREKEAALAAEAAAREEAKTGRQVLAAMKDAREEANKSFKDTVNQKAEDARDGKTKLTKLHYIVKADVSGSAEAVEMALSSLPLTNQPVQLSILRSGVGPVNQNDVALASAAASSPPSASSSGVKSGASARAPTSIIVSFNQHVPSSMASEAERAGVRICGERIIYKVIDTARGIVEGHLPPVIEHRVTGEADCLQAFEIQAPGANRKSTVRVAGCRVKNGTLARNSKVKVLRGGIGGDVVYEGTLSSLKNVKRDATEMKKGTECGVGFDGWDKFESGDVIQCLLEKSVPSRLPG